MPGYNQKQTNTHIHTPNLGISEAGDLGQVVLSARGDAAKEHLLGAAAAHHHAHAIHELRV